MTGRFGRGFSRANRVSMRAFYLAWLLEQICQTPFGQSAGAQAALQDHVDWPSDTSDRR
ncbi:hypothetical protein KQH60_09745 [Mycetohabitans sp. B8]|uniref:hypothetical protein n=1 Tax=Mycetohabitans sp. B8 TaxID=2841845 RepID=UPI001F446F30|nr:hypothetical protein [Mycetohabitans sp. B8]MCG1042803.1 hypothetical protein [Mycetohabitans sp. B8]